MLLQGMEFRGVGPKFQDSKMKALVRSQCFSPYFTLFIYLNSNHLFQLCEAKTINLIITGNEWSLQMLMASLILLQ